MGKKNNVTCVICGKPFHLKPSQAARTAHPACCKEHYIEWKHRSMSGEGNHQYGVKGKKNASFKGDLIPRRNNQHYEMWIYLPDHPHADKGGRVKLYRYLVEQRAENFDPKYFETIDGRVVLKRSTYIHHLDGDHYNNDLGNLVPVTMAEHRIIHNLLNPQAKDEKTGRFVHDGKGLAIDYCVFNKKYGVAPFHGTDGSAGYDLHIASYEETEKTIKYWFGIGIKIPDGYYGLMVARSSMWKKGQRLNSGACIIDSDFVGELSAVFDKGPGFQRLEIGDRPVQIVILKHEYIDFIEKPALEQTARGAGGYGSTGA